MKYATELCIAVLNRWIVSPSFRASAGTVVAYWVARVRGAL